MSSVTVESLLNSIPTGLLIGGQWRAASTGATLDVFNPATGKKLVEIADASPEDGAAAIAAAAEAQESWSRTSPFERSELLRAGFEELHRRADEFALLMTLEMGKPLGEAKGEVAYGAEFLRWFAEEAKRIDGSYTVAPDGKTRLLVTKRPVGPCYLITPWNFPLAMATRKIAPAIAAGCTSVLKPASLTPLTSMYFAQVMQEVGVPAGVINVIPTTHSGAVTGAILSDDRVRKLSFTGSTPVGKRLIEQSADKVLKVSMELGGNAPFVVFEDADLDAAVEGAMIAKLRNMGEACTAANRFIVHERVADAFAEKLAERMDALVVGDGTDPNTNIGPLVDGKAHAGVAALVESAVAQGARVATTRSEVPGDGFFFAPTVLTGVSADNPILRNEIFGPVAPVVTFSTEDEAVALANAPEYGLVAYAYTADMQRALRLTERLETGMLGINTGLVSNPAAPFGGVKQSGLGREGGHDGIEEFLETMYVALPSPF